MTNGNQRPGWGEGNEERIEKIEAAIDAGEVRENISCEEARREWFVMARNMYVGNNPEPRIPIDYEVGFHTASCSTLGCRALTSAYFTLLKPSHPDSAELLADTLDELEKQVNSDQN